MGSSESTGRSNGTKEEEEQRLPENDSSGGGSGRSATAIAVAVAGTAVAAAVVISKVPSAGKDTESQEIKASSREANYSSSSNFNGHLVSESSCQPKSTLDPWSPPPLGRFKMNTDGGAHPNPGPAGYGGILRDERGQWVLGFRGFIGEDDGLTAEFHGILKGLELLDKLGLTGSILESDCEPAIKLIEKTGSSYDGNSEIVDRCWGMIKECRHLIHKNKIIINHVNRDKANKCAHKLADMGIDCREQYMLIKILPDAIKQLVEDDLRSFREHTSKP